MFVCRDQMGIEYIRIYSYRMIIKEVKDDKLELKGTEKKNKLAGVDGTLAFLGFELSRCWLGLIYYLLLMQFSLNRR